MADIWNLINQIPLDFLAPFSEIITAEFVTTAHSLGQRVYAYQVNSKELGDKLIAMGVDEIGTDFPKLFVESKMFRKVPTESHSSANAKTHFKMVCFYIMLMI